ncbi:MAG: ABC transporter permease subunit, partial [Nitrospirota bacterium]|nr:ABC transporter permease subunit [Nitrospirota bacterium]
NLVTGAGCFSCTIACGRISTVDKTHFSVKDKPQYHVASGGLEYEAAWALGASKVDAFFTVASPMAIRGYLSAIVLGFAHTLGEFGVVLMVGGNIPGVTKVLSIAIYDHVEVLEYSQAHFLSAFLLIFSFLILTVVYTINRRLPVHVS